MMSSPTLVNASAQTTPRRVDSISTAKRKAFEEVSLNGAIRKEIRTYGKRVKVNAATPPAKRQRIKDQRSASIEQQSRTAKLIPVTLAPPIKGASIKSYFRPTPIPSSPTSKQTASDFSDPAERNSTPPSSPPSPPIPTPLVRLKNTQRPRRRLNTRLLPISKPKMSFEPGSTSGGSTSNESGSSSEINPSGETSTQNASAQRSSSSNSGSSGQLVFDNSLGLTSSVTCPDCTMHYNRTKKDEVAMHTKYHANFFNESALRSNESSRQVVWNHPSVIDHQIICVDRNSAGSMKDFALAVLEHTYNDLGGLSYKDDTVFMEIDNPDPGSEGKVPRYKIYIYLDTNVPVAFLLAERIAQAGYYYEGETQYDLDGPWPSIVPPPEGEERQAYVYMDDPQRAIMLVDRIWTKPNYRRASIATKLINSARDGHFVPRYAIPRHQIAFSWPTAQGKAFAEKYQEGCFDEYPFLVDFESPPLVVEDEKLVETFVNKW